MFAILELRNSTRAAGEEKEKYFFGAWRILYVSGKHGWKGVNIIRTYDD
jgi:hypothetical protein